MKWREQAALLLKKAEGDQFVAARLAPDPQSPDEAIGFHAQQAVEKTLKAVLSFKAAAYRRTHDLVELIDLLRDHQIAFPPDLEDVRRLGPFATTFRYDYIPADTEEPFDRAWAVDCVRRVMAWARALIGQTDEGP